MDGTLSYSHYDSPDGLYRYWVAVENHSIDGGTVAFVLTNPADGEVASRIIERCCRRTFEFGILGVRYRKVIITSIFARRAKDGMTLRRLREPVGPENDALILDSAQQADMVIVGWGEVGKHQGRGKVVAGMLESAGIELHAIATTSRNIPKNPLYQSYRKEPRPWRSSDIPPSNATQMVVDEELDRRKNLKKSAESLALDEVIAERAAKIRENWPQSRLDKQERVTPFELQIWDHIPDGVR